MGKINNYLLHIPSFEIYYSFFNLRFLLKLSDRGKCSRRDSKVMCSSRKYPYFPLPQWTLFALDPPSPLEFPYFLNLVGYSRKEYFSQNCCCTINISTSKIIFSLCDKMKKESFYSPNNFEDFLG